MQLPRIETNRLSGSEPFRAAGEDLGFDVHEFWSWSTSDLVSNATRGVLAEFIVGKALGAAPRDRVRTEWSAYDLLTPDGVKVEVKTSAYVQSWHQNQYSKPYFSVRKSRYWDASDGVMASEPGRPADVYVFALLDHKDQDTIDPLNLDQWRFYVVPTAVLDARERSQHSITLPSLERIAGGAVSFAGLADAVAAASSRDQGSSRSS